MTALDSSVYRRQDITLPPMASHRRATVGSPPPFSFSNTFESHRPASRTDRLGPSGFPYRDRRSTVSGHSQGHNVNHAPPLSHHVNENVMLSDSASPSPALPNAALFPSASPTPSSSSGSPRHSQSSFEYENTSFAHSLNSPLQSAFPLCPSPDFPSHLTQPRSMQQPNFLASSFSAAGSTIRPSTSTTSNATTTPALSPAASAASFSLDTPDPTLSTWSRERVEAELMHCRHRVRELEFFNDLHRLRVAELENVDSDNKARVHNELGLFASELPPSTGEQWIAPPDWHMRTSARLKRFCALNRAGNALCAWHDSRRERRAYPPRMAPPNTLNCGCTYDEALFEESLARNNVGAFYPGESVRMDPALRNPLLKLLKERYGYRDGDFERRPNGSWREGEDAQSWEQRISSTRASSKRER